MSKNTSLSEKQLLLPILSEKKAPLCACGCGMPTKWHTKYKRFNIYISGHNTKAMWQDTEYRENISKQRKKQWQNTEFRESMSKQRKEQWQDPIFRDKMAKQSKAIWQDPIRRDMVSKQWRELWQDPMYKENISKRMKIIWEDTEYRDNQSKQRKVRGKDPEFRKNISKQSKERWQNPKFREKMLKANTKTPNKPETIINMITSGDIQYTGNRAFWRKIRILVNGEYVEKYKNPDFKIKGQNKVIELYGDYWHKNDNPDDLIEAYKEAGLDCLIIWEHELKDVDSVLIRIGEFIGQEQWQLELSLVEG